MINGAALVLRHDAFTVNLVAVLGLALAGGGLLAGAGMPGPARWRAAGGAPASQAARAAGTS